MLYSSKNREDLEKLEGFSSFQNQVNAVRLQEKLGKQKFHEDVKKVFESGTDTNENASEDLTKTMTLTSKKNNKALEKLNNKLPEILNDRGIVASCLLPPLSEITILKKTILFKLVKDSSTKRIKHLLIHNSMGVTLYDNFSFCDTGKILEMKGDLLKKITNNN